AKWASKFRWVNCALRVLPADCTSQQLAADLIVRFVAKALPHSEQDCTRDQPWLYLHKCQLLKVKRSKFQGYYRSPTAANARLMWKALGRTDYFPIDVTHVNTTATPNCLQEPLSKSLEGTKWQRHYECAVASPAVRTR